MHFVHWKLLWSNIKLRKSPRPERPPIDWEAEFYDDELEWQWREMLMTLYWTLAAVFTAALFFAFFWELLT